MSELMHRIFLAPIRGDVDLTWAHEHWTAHHGEVFSRTPGLRGYTQNRPPRSAWSGRTHVCAESWFDDRDAEKAAFSSDYYLTAVVEDEARFVQRDQAWLSRVTMTKSASSQLAYRVLAFGQTEHGAADWLASWDPDDIDVLALSRQPWTCAELSALGLWTDDLTRAVDAVVHFGPLAFLTQPVAVVPAPESPWTPA
jgi:uncharacterized protein (TIGR02118 family)